MPGRLRFVYNEVLQAANQFSREAHETRQLYQHLKNETEELHGGAFKGRTSDAWFKEMEQELLPATMRLSQILERAATMLKAIHQTFQGTEEEVGGLFKARG